jgi:hypothetical protein
VSNTATLKDLYLLEKGAKFVMECRGWGYNPLEDGKSIFWCAKMYRKYHSKGHVFRFFGNSKFIDFISNHANKINQNFAREMRWEDEVVGSSNLAKYLRSCQNKYKAREEQTNLVASATRNLVANWTRRSGGWHSILTKFGMKIVTRKGKDCKNVSDAHTSEGRVCYGTVKGATYVNGKLARKVRDLNVVKVGKTCFAWEQDFVDHNEGKTVKEAVSAFLSRTGIKGNKISFAMVVAAKGFCIAGTKRWLLQNLPHLGSLLKPYTEWAQVPNDLMDEEFEFESRKWFKGRV